MRRSWWGREAAFVRCSLLASGSTLLCLSFRRGGSATGFLPLDYYTFSFRIVLKSQRRWYKHLSDENHCDSSIARDYVCSFFSESYAAEANDAAGVDVAKDCALP